MLRRLISLVLVAFALGFVAFAVTLPRAADGEKSDGAVALTGGGNRIDRGLEVLRQGQARRLLVAGVDPEVQPREFAVLYRVDPRLMACCITLGFESVDTRSNARETAQWVAENHVRSLRLITSDWHMRRAAFELRRALPAGFPLVIDAVPTRPSFDILIAEYAKWLARHVQVLWPS